MFINIQISSKNKNSLKNFFEFFIKICGKKNLKTALFLKYFPRHTTKNVFTILKSPHVNKTAQEQFGYSIFSKQINIQTFQMLKFLIILKKIQTQLFPDVQIKIKYILQEKKFKIVRTQILNPNNYRVNYFPKNEFQDTKSYLKLFDIFGIQFLN